MGMASSRRSGAIGIVGLLIGLAGLAFVTRTIIREWDEITETLTSANPSWLLAAGLAVLAGMTVIGWNWLVMLGRRDPALPLGAGFMWYFVGQLGKYVPGGIWPIVGRAELATRAGASRSAAYQTTALSMFATYGAAVLVAAVAGLASPADRRLIAVALAIGTGIVLGMLFLPAARVQILRVVHRLTRRELNLPEGTRVLFDIFRHVPVWLFIALGNVFTVIALGGDVDLGLVVDLTFATSLSWIIGFVVIGVPGGLGVREATFIALMSDQLGPGLATSAALAGRVLSIAADLVGAAGSLPLGRSGKSQRNAVPSPIPVDESAT
jgi:uncharacterized membrane protein YbhN (UPF0104 family)